jgi:Mn-containing catalase
MSFHEQELQHDATPDEPDPIHASHLQEVLGGLGAEESGHVEMLAIMIAELLETAPVEATEDAMEDPTPAAVIGGGDIQHAIVAGAGARPVDSNGNPWQGSFVTASGDRHPTERTA